MNVVGLSGQAEAICLDNISGNHHHVVQQWQKALAGQRVINVPAKSTIDDVIDIGMGAFFPEGKNKTLVKRNKYRVDGLGEYVIVRGRQFLTATHGKNDQNGRQSKTTLYFNNNTVQPNR